MKFIATYDLSDTEPSPYSTFLEQAEGRGWSTWIKGTGGAWYELPNTTLVGTFANLDAAVDALRAARSDAERELGVSVKMTKWIVAAYTNTKFTSDERQES